MLLTFLKFNKKKVPLGELISIAPGNCRQFHIHPSTDGAAAGGFSPILTADKTNPCKPQGLINGPCRFGGRLIMELSLCTVNVSQICWDIFHFHPGKEASRRCLEGRRVLNLVMHHA